MRSDGRKKYNVNVKEGNLEICKKTIFISIPLSCKINLLTSLRSHIRTKLKNNEKTTQTSLH